MIDRLMQRARARFERPIIAFILRQEDGSFFADSRFWNGVRGSRALSIVTHHATEREALENTKNRSESGVLIYGEYDLE